MIELYVNGRSEWFSASQIESILQQTPYIELMLICADRNEPYPIAIVIPSKIYETQKDLRASILLELKIIGEKNKLKPHEIPVFVIIDKPGSWTVDNGLLSASGKLCRYKIMQKYRHDISMAYASLSSK